MWHSIVIIIIANIDEGHHLPTCTTFGLNMSLIRRPRDSGSLISDEESSNMSPATETLSSRTSEWAQSCRLISVVLSASRATSLVVTAKS